MKTLVVFTGRKIFIIRQSRIQTKQGTLIKKGHLIT